VLLGDSGRFEPNVSVADRCSYGPGARELSEHPARLAHQELPPERRHAWVEWPTRRGRIAGDCRGPASDWRM